MNGRKLSNYDLPETGRTIPRLICHTIEFTEAEQIAAAWIGLQTKLLNLNEEQTLVFITTVGAAEAAMTWENIERLPSEVPRPPNALVQPHHNNDAEDLSSPRYFF